MLDAAVRTVTGFAVLLLLTRLAGKKQISQMTVFTYVSGIALGSMAGEMVMNKDIVLHEGILSLVLWSALIFCMEYLSLKMPPVRILLDGEPSIVVKRGVIQVDSLKKSRLNMDDLTMLLREKDVFSMKDVRYAILEPHGELTVVKKAEAGQPEPPYLPGELITDGNVIHRNLREFGKTHHWLREQLAARGIQSEKDVLYAELEADGSLFFQTKR